MQRRAAVIASAALLLALAALIVAPIARSAGVPAFQQDWQWPVSPTQCSGVLQLATQPWNSGGAGGAQVYPEPWWPYFVEYAACAGTSPHIGVIVEIAFFVVLAGFFAGALAQRIFHTAPASISAMALYVGNPVVLNKIQAGHLLFLASYALAPAVAYTALFARGKLRWLVAGTLIGLGSAQQQFFLFDALIYAVFAIPGRGIAGIADFCATMATAIVFTGSEWILAIAFGGGTSLNVLAPLPHYEAAQSAKPLDAIRTIGYIGGYDKRLLEPLLWALWIPPALALAGAAFHGKRGVCAQFALLAAIGFLIVTGVFGPAALLWGYAFQHIRAAGVLRELYNGAGLISLGIAMLAAAAVAAAAARSRTLAVALACVSALLAGFVGSRSAASLPMYGIDARTESALRTIAQMPGRARFLTVPSIYPLAIEGTNAHGLSPLTLPLGAHMSANAITASFPVTYAARQAETSLPHGELDRSLTIAALVRVPRAAAGYRSTLEPALRDISGLAEPETRTATDVASLADASRLRVTAIQGRPATLAAVDTRPLIIDALHGGTSIDLVALQTSVDPRKSWVRTAFWPVLEQWVYAAPPGVFTLRRTLRLRTPAAMLVAGAQNGPPAAPGCTILQRLDRHFALYRCAADPFFTGTPPIAIASAAAGAATVPPLPAAGAPGVARIIDDRAWKISAQIQAKAGSALILSESYDPHWRLSDASAKHVRIDGWANGWIFYRDVNGPLTLEYSPARAFFAMLYLSYALAAAALVSLFLGHCTFREQHAANFSQNKLRR